jgi:hypothetical protein
MASDAKYTVARWDREPSHVDGFIEQKACRSRIPTAETLNGLSASADDTEAQWNMRRLGGGCTELQPDAGGEGVSAGRRVHAASGN